MKLFAQAVVLGLAAAACGARTNLLLPDAGAVAGDDGGGPSEAAPPCTLMTCGASCVDLSSSATNCGGCGHSCLGGTCRAGSCQPVVLASGKNFQSMVIDANTVYAATFDTVYAIPKQGGVLITRADNQSIINGLAVDDSNLYWTRQSATGGPSGIMGAHKTGGPPNLLVPGDGALEVVVFNGRLYWTNPSSVSWAMISGGTAQTIANGETFPLGLAVDQSYLYWCEIGDLNKDSGGGNVYDWPLGGGGMVIPIGQTLNEPQEVALDATSYYLTTAGTMTGKFRDGMILKGTRDVGQPTPLVVSQPYPFAIAVDGQFVYWTNVAQTDHGEATENHNGTIMRAPKGGGSPDTLATAQTQPVRIAVDQKAIYWANGGTYANGMSNDDGALMKLAK